MNLLVEMRVMSMEEGGQGYRDEGRAGEEEMKQISNFLASEVKYHTAETLEGEKFCESEGHYNLASPTPPPPPPAQIGKRLWTI